MPKGIFIHLLKPGPPVLGIQPLRVRVEFAGRSVSPSLYVNSRPVTWEDFATVLQQELNRRPPHWPVYFEGDPDLDWRDAMKVIDTIRGLQAEVVLLKTARASPRGQSGSGTTPRHGHL